MGITKGGEEQGIYYVDKTGNKITDLSKFNPSTDKIYINAEYIKTGTLDAAGNCLILMAEDTSSNPFISIVMGAETKDYLYQDMSALLAEIPKNE